MVAFSPDLSAEVFSLHFHSLDIPSPLHSKDKQNEIPCREGTLNQVAIQLNTQAHINCLLVAIKLHKFESSGAVTHVH